MKTKTAHTPTYPGVVITRSTLSVDDGKTHYGWSTVARAVNSHEELLEAAKEVLRRATNENFTWGPVNQLHAAIAKAEAQS